MNVFTKKPAAFNEWLAPHGKTAVVPSRDHLAEESDQRNERQEKNGKYTTYWVHEGPEFYAVSLPHGTAGYRFNKLPAKKRLMYNGKPLQIDLDGSIQFSKDGNWALYPPNHGYFGGCFLISLKTGQVRKLRGGEAIFL